MARVAPDLIIVQFHSKLKLVSIMGFDDKARSRTRTNVSMNRREKDPKINIQHPEKPKDSISETFHEPASGTTQRASSPQPSPPEEERERARKPRGSWSQWRVR